MVTVEEVLAWIIGNARQWDNEQVEAGLRGDSVDVAYAQGTANAYWSVAGLLEEVGVANVACGV